MGKYIVLTFLGDPGIYGDYKQDFAFFDQLEPAEMLVKAVRQNGGKAELSRWESLLPGRPVIHVGTKQA